MLVCLYVCMCMSYLVCGHLLLRRSREVVPRRSGHLGELIVDVAILLLDRLVLCDGVRGDFAFVVERAQHLPGTLHISELRSVTPLIRVSDQNLPKVGFLYLVELVAQTFAALEIHLGVNAYRFETVADGGLVCSRHAWIVWIEKAALDL
jgi:hypothetical protein